ncbi:hypothetical protein VN0438_01130 [Helicobacter pylori]|nr:hypothetical protein VN0438_01130 [Helicobacter pylori]
MYFNEREFKNDPIPFTFLSISGLKKEPNEMKETIQKLHELDNDPIVLIDDDRKDGSDPQKQKANKMALIHKKQKANNSKELIKKWVILSKSYSSQVAMKISNKLKMVSVQTIEKNTPKTNAWNWPWRSKQGSCIARKMMLVGEETKNNFKKLFEWIKERVKQPND